MFKIEVKTNKCFSLIHSIYVFIFIGLHFDCRLNWKEHITRKRKQSDLKTKEINWLIGKKIPYIYRKQITHLQSGNQT